MTQNKIVLATLGTHGDLHPFIAVALVLKQRGFDPVIATYPDFRADVEAAGLTFRPIRPTPQQIEIDLGMSRTEMFRAARKGPQVILTKFILPYLRQSYEDSLAAMADAQLVITNTIAFGAKLAAEKLGVPHVGVALQPYALLSAYDPPLLGNALRISKLVYSGGLHLTRAFLQIGRLIARGWARPLVRFRRQIGLPRLAAHPFFEGQFVGVGAIGLYSSLLGKVQPDFPPHFVIAGFAFYDGVSAAGKHADLQTFLDSGGAPLVFTLGTSAVHDGAEFVRVALEATKQLGERAVLVLDEPQRAQRDGETPANVLITSYVPYSSLFHRAKAIVHHGGIGTTAQALRSGRPQLIAPYFVDQPDNAARVERLGVARIIPLEKWTVGRVVQELRLLISDPALLARAEEIGREVSRENGAAILADVVTQCLPKSHTAATRC